MPTIEDRAICIRHWAFSETSQTVSLLTREHGVVRGLAKGARRERGAFSGGIDLLALGHMAAIVKPGRDLSTLTRWDVDETFPVLRQRLAANRTGWLMADLVHHMLTAHDPHPVTFDALETALSELGHRDAGIVLLLFQWTLLVDCGYRPELNRDADTGAALPAGAETLAFSPGAGGIVLDTGAEDRWRVRRPTIDVLRTAAGGDVPCETGGISIERANRLLATYACHIVGRELRSLVWALPASGQRA